MSVSYIFGSEENIPDLSSVDTKISTGFKSYLKVSNKVYDVFYNMRVRNKVSVGFSSKLKIKKKIYPGFSSYDQETLEMLGEI